MKKKSRSADIFANQIDVMTYFAVIANVVIKRVHCQLKISPSGKELLIRFIIAGLS